MTVAVLVPVLRRPHRVAPLIESIDAATPEPHRVLFVGSPGDTAEHDAVRQAGGELLVIDTPCGAGDYARKINAGHRHTDEPYLFLAADDIHFRPGWLERAMSHMVGRVGVVGTNDLGNGQVMAGRHATHSLVARWYADLGTVDDRSALLHEGYDHNFVDNELVGTAMARRAWDFAPDSIVEHLHPSWKKAEWDDVYERGQAGWKADQRLFRERMAMWKARTLPMTVPA